MGSWSCCNLKILFCVFLVCAVFFIVSLILAFVVFPDVINTEINKATRLEEGTEQYDRFIEIPFPLSFKVYIFNVENPEEILKGTAKPIVTEKGPYVYRQHRHKTVITTDNDEDTISYTQMETFEFDAGASGNFTEDDMVTVLNPPLMSIYQMAEDLSLAEIVDNCIRSTFPAGYDEIFIKVPVRHLLFEGFNFCRNKGDDLCTVVNDVVCALAQTKRNSDTLPDYSLQFSFLNYKAREPDGKYTVSRGMNDIDSLGHIMAWNDMKYTTYWKEATTCDQVKGTDSTIYPPRITSDSKFYIFATDICRHVEIDYIGEASYDGVNGYMFGTNAQTLKSSKSNPTDDCYCTLDTRDANGTKSCFLDGVVDMQPCFGVPVLLSFPHFLWAAEQYQDAVDGLVPDVNKHRTFLIVEPNTGTPLRGAKRIQLNAIIRPITGIKYLAQTTRAVLPLIWIEEGVTLPDKYVDELSSTYFDKVRLVAGIEWTLVAVSSVLMVTFGGLTIRKRFFKKS